ncbi:alpha-N-acetylgalactosamine-specific lectin-like [Pomacea canaliculata]|uniref:alpha-N-acetylgalactosamine-specific lectin-like n=1 Tax=Pomacea canaliculata TaxID=400727 RepID=UPI000D72B36F|nr:alpha-N-acetylgalactosamine-specific lectin-like [Pomacea canaliculata]
MFITGAAVLTVFSTLVWCGSVQEIRHGSWRRMHSVTAATVTSRNVLRCASRCWSRDGCCKYFVHPQDGSCSTYLEDTVNDRMWQQYDSVPALACPASKGYSLHYCRCIMLVTTVTVYSNAQLRCQQDGGHVMHYKSLTVDRPAVTSLLSNKTFTFSGTTRLWVGGKDENKDGLFEWTDGEVIDQASGVWSTGEPSISPDESCVVLRPEYRMADQNCSKTHSYICQIDV